MAEQLPYPGKLIAIDGTRGKDVAVAAKAVMAALTEAGIACAISRFDASGLFGELDGSGARHLSARTMTLVYAADLAFRLRWEIRPVLDAGGVIIAAPYVDTAVAFGVSCNLDETWIRALLRFAPAPDVRAAGEERKLDRGWKPRVDRGYGEFGAAMMEGSGHVATSKQTRQAAIALLARPAGRQSARIDAGNAAAVVKRVRARLKA